MANDLTVFDEGMTTDEISTFSHHVAIEELGNVLANRASKDDPSYFRIVVAYYLGVVASSMRAKVNDPAKGGTEIPINTYCIALAPSGYGKGKATTCMERDIIADFRNLFLDVVAPQRTEINLWKLASHFSAKNGTDDQTEYDKLVSELKRLGVYRFVFDGGSEAAIKQMRDRLLRMDCASINLQVDEIGQNIEKMSVVEAMNAYLELYDLGYIKD